MKSRLREKYPKPGGAIEGKLRKGRSTEEGWEDVKEKARELNMGRDKSGD